MRLKEALVADFIFLFPKASLHVWEAQDVGVDWGIMCLGDDEASQIWGPGKTMFWVDWGEFLKKGLVRLLLGGRGDADDALY